MALAWEYQRGYFMKHMMLFLLFTTSCLSAQMLAEATESRNPGAASGPGSVKEYIAESRRMGSE